MKCERCYFESCCDRQTCYMHKSKDRNVQQQYTLEEQDLPPSIRHTSEEEFLNLNLDLDLEEDDHE